MKDESQVQPRCASQFGKQASNHLGSLSAPEVWSYSWLPMETVYGIRLGIRHTRHELPCDWLNQVEEFFPNVTSSAGIPAVRQTTIATTRCRQSEEGNQSHQWSPRFSKPWCKPLEGCRLPCPQKRRS